MFIYKFSAGTKQAAKSNGYNTVLCAFEATPVQAKKKTPTKTKWAIEEMGKYTERKKKQKRNAIQRLK